mmetsp:Transcript_35374/g.101013  ORF Transcript_35374/g.101013 Transcript_35374/m.101013 type:complete len:297 (-) Transcript_35374:668-1558(-)
MEILHLLRDLAQRPDAPLRGPLALVHEHRDVDALCAAAQLHATFYELVDVDDVRLFRVQQLKKVECLADRELHGREVGLNRIVLHAILKLAQRYRAGVSRVHEIEDLLEPHGVDFLRIEHGLDHHVLVHVGALNRRLAEDACDHVEHCKYREEDVHQKEQHPAKVDAAERLRNLLPAYTTGDRLEKGEDGPVQVAVVPHELVVSRPRGMIDQVLRDGLRENDPEQVEDRQEHEHRPHERPQGAHHGGKEDAQGAEVPHHADGPEQPHGPNDAENPKGRNRAHPVILERHGGNDLQR